MNKSNNLLQILNKLSNNKDVSGIRAISENNNPIDFADAFKSLETNNLLFSLQSLKGKILSDVFAHLDVKQHLIIIKNFTKKELKPIFKEMFNDDIVEIIEELPKELVKKVVQSINKEERVKILNILKYVDDTAGSVMTTEFVYINHDLTVKQAISRIKELGQKRIETYSSLYVLDHNSILIGVVKLFDLIFATQNKRVKNLIKNKPISVFDYTDQEQVAEVMKKYEISVIPVLNTNRKLLGIITADDILSIVEEEATEDIHKMAAVTPTFTQYSKTSVWSLFKSRVFWLLILMVTATVSQIVIEENISNNDIIILAALIPLVMDTAGNAGGQSGATIIRAISTNDIKISDYWRVIRKEIFVATLIGTVLFVANYVRMIFLGKSPTISFVTSFSVFVIIVFAKWLGATLPILAKKFRLDPAVVAAPLITTIVDLLAIVILFSVYKTLIL